MGNVPYHAVLHPALTFGQYKHGVDHVDDPIRGLDVRCDSSASLTVTDPSPVTAITRTSPWPVSVESRVPACSDGTDPSTMWKRRSSSRPSTVRSGILPKASSVGANTGNGSLPWSVSKTSVASNSVTKVVNRMSSTMIPTISDWTMGSDSGILAEVMRVAVSCTA